MSLSACGNDGFKEELNAKDDKQVLAVITDLGKNIENSMNPQAYQEKLDIAVLHAAHKGYIKSLSASFEVKNSPFETNEKLDTVKFEKYFDSKTIRILGKRPKSELKDVEILILAIAYEHGLGMTQDKREAASLYRSASLLGMKSSAKALITLLSSYDGCLNDAYFFKRFSGLDTAIYLNTSTSKSYLPKGKMIKHAKFNNAIGLDVEEKAVQLLAVEEGKRVYSFFDSCSLKKK